jgi:hypothetical protein
MRSIPLYNLHDDRKIRLPFVSDKWILDGVALITVRNAQYLYELGRRCRHIKYISSHSYFPPVSSGITGHKSQSKSTRVTRKMIYSTNYTKVRQSYKDPKRRVQPTELLTVDVQSTSSSHQWNTNPNCFFLIIFTIQRKDGSSDPKTSSLPNTRSPSCGKSLRSAPNFLPMGSVNLICSLLLHLQIKNQNY